MDPACAWEAAVTPLQWEEVEATWAELCAGEQASKNGSSSSSSVLDTGLLTSMLDDITDAHLLHWSLNEAGAVELWPVTAAQVVATGAVPAAWLEEAAARLQPLAGLLSSAAVAAQAARAGAKLL